MTEPPASERVVDEPETPEPVTPEAETPEPAVAETPEPVTPEPVTPEPVTAEPVTPEPVVAEPETPAPVTAETPAPVAAADAEPKPQPEPEPVPASEPILPPPAAPVVPAVPADPASEQPESAEQSTAPEPPASTPFGYEAPEAQAGDGRRTALLLGAGLLLLLTVLAAVAAGYVKAKDGEQERTEQARIDGLAVSRDAARALFSYNHETLDDDFARGISLTTGEFRDEYSRTTEEVVRDVATEYKAVVRADVQEAGVISATDEEVVTLVFLNQVTTSTRVEGQKIDQSRVRMRLVLEDGQWRVAKVEAL